VETWAGARGDMLSFAVDNQLATSDATNPKERHRCGAPVQPESNGHHLAPRSERRPAGRVRELGSRPFKLNDGRRGGLCASPSVTPLTAAIARGRRRGAAGAPPTRLWDRLDFAASGWLLDLNSENHVGRRRRHDKRRARNAPATGARARVALRGSRGGLASQPDGAGSPFNDIRSFSTESRKRRRLGLGNPKQTWSGRAFRTPRPRSRAWHAPGAYRFLRHRRFARRLNGRRASSHPGFTPARRATSAIGIAGSIFSHSTCRESTERHISLGRSSTRLAVCAASPGVGQALPAGTTCGGQRPVFAATTRPRAIQTAASGACGGRGITRRRIRSRLPCDWRRLFLD